MSHTARQQAEAIARGRGGGHAVRDWLALVLLIAIVLAVAFGELTGVTAGLVHNITLGG